MVDKLCHVLTLSVFSFFSALQLMQSWVFYEINIANTNKQYPSISSIFVSLVTRRAVVLESKNYSWTLPTMLGVVASLLVVVGKRMQQLPTMLEPECTKERIQPIRLCKPRVMQCWKSCANGSNIVAVCFGNHRTKQMLGVVGSKVRLVSNFAYQLPTTCNNMQQGVQTDRTSSIQQYWAMFRPFRCLRGVILMKAKSYL